MYAMERHYLIGRSIALPVTLFRRRTGRLQISGRFFASIIMEPDVFLSVVATIKTSRVESKAQDKVTP